MNKLQLAVQEQMVPGPSLIAKFDTAVRLGYDAIELRGGPDFKLERRLQELQAAKAAGVVMQSDCVEMSHFIGAFDPALSRDAIDNLKSQLGVMAEIGGPGACVVTPAAWGMASHRLPKLHPTRNAAGDREVMVGALSTLGEHAKRVGALLLLEPLNRYEDHMANTMDAAAELVRESGGEGLGIVADTYHMNIEEDDLRQSVLDAAPYLYHVQLGDSSRYQPGTGHFDWQTTLGALQDIGYDGYMALECRLRGQPEVALRQGADFMRRQWELAAATRP